MAALRIFLMTQHEEQAARMRLRLHNSQTAHRNLIENTRERGNMMDFKSLLSDAGGRQPCSHTDGAVCDANNCEEMSTQQQSEHVKHRQKRR
jgi:hypothetical protein